ncbi:hypothetical protein [Aliivibrio wodanis]|uniref:hypothetical protein n=1 Tax=Aliivibrio wodanis TaxID=80852 RepID=UPI00406D3A80
MKYLLFLLISFSSVSYGAVSCSDVIKLDNNMRVYAHKLAQTQAQKDIELMVKEKVITPYIDNLGKPTDFESMILNIEENWCSDLSLYQSYYYTYLANRQVFNVN